MIGAFGVAAAMLSFAIGLEIQDAAARPDPAATSVNRTLKGNRLPLVPTERDASPAMHMPAPQLPRGCESSFSSLRNAYSNEIAGRCVG
ncbi:MAG: hypothetical protein QOI12_390 [Alphaproteobacteria bacterium]|nr:hypothetical protein [Alphaproteobacteria bacterium]